MLSFTIFLILFVNVANCACNQIRENDTLYVDFSGPEWRQEVEGLPCAMQEGGCYPLATLYRRLGWAQVIFIVDEDLSPEHFITTMDKERLVQVMLLRQGSVALGDWLIQQATLPRDQSGSREANVTVLCSVDCVKGVLKDVKRIDRHYGTTSKLRTSTNLVIAITSGRLNDLIGVSLPLDNVIILTPFRANLQNDVIYSDVYTLMWRNDGRSLDHVVRLVDGENNLANDSQPKSSVRALSYWPNRLFGFNDRTLVIVTKEACVRALFSPEIFQTGAVKRLSMEKMTKFLWSRTTMSSVVNVSGSGGQVKEWRGLYFDILHMLQSTLNFSYCLTEPSDDSWGSTATNSTFGLTGDLVSGEADVGLAQYFIIPHSTAILDFPSAIGFSQIVMVWRRPEIDHLLPPLLTIVSPLLMEVMLGSLVFATVLLCVMEHLSPAGSSLAAHAHHPETAHRPQASLTDDNDALPTAPERPRGRTPGPQRRRLTAANTRTLQTASVRGSETLPSPSYSERTLDKPQLGSESRQKRRHSLPGPIQLRGMACCTQDLAAVGRLEASSLAPRPEHHLDTSQSSTRGFCGISGCSPRPRQPRQYTSSCMYLEGCSPRPRQPRQYTSSCMYGEGCSRRPRQLQQYTSSCMCREGCSPRPRQPWQYTSSCMYLEDVFSIPDDDYGSQIPPPRGSRSLHRRQERPEHCRLHNSCTGSSATFSTLASRVTRLTVGAALLQGSRALPEAWSSRSVLSAWWLTCIILTTAYSANMAAHFSIAKQRPLFRSLEDLVGQSEYRWGLLQNASIYLTMLKSNLSVYKQVLSGVEEFRKTDPTVLSGDMAHHIHKVVTEKYVFIEGRPTIEAISEVDVCQLQVSDGFLWMYDTLLLRKNSVLTGFFSDLILQIHATGIMDELNRRWFSPHYCPTAVTAPTSITLHFLQGALYLTAACLFLAALTLSAELLLVRWRRFKH